jgi:hypothetical protein
MPSLLTGRQLHKVIPIMRLLLTAVPKLFQIMKNSLSLMIATGVLSILLLHVILPTPLIDTSQLVLFGLEKNFLFGLGILLFLLLFYVRG